MNRRTIRWSPPAHHPLQNLTYKGVQLVAGRTVEVSESIASRIVRDYPECVKVVKGGAIRPADPAIPATAKALAQEILRRGEVFDLDPNAALDGIPELGALKGLPEAKGLDSLAEDVAAGVGDDRLFGLALLGRLCGSALLCQAVLDRHKALAEQAAG